LATIAFLETELSIPSKRVGTTGLIPGLTSEILVEHDIIETMLNKEVTQTAKCTLKAQFLQCLNQLVSLGCCGNL
jgi:hypothetical protein